MKMNGKAKPEVNLGNDVQTIRNILFGEHLESIQQHIDTLDQQVAELRKENEALRKALEAEIERRFQVLNGRADQLNGAFEQSKNEQAAADQKTRKDFDSKIQEVSKRLLVFEDQQGGLIASLAQALLDHKNKPGK
jgi:chromosome segregation ATPase